MDFVIDDRNFRAEKLSAKQQFHLSRKIAPLIPPLAPLFFKMSELEGKLNSTSILSLTELAEPFAEALAMMKDSDSDQVLDLTLGSVKVETTPGTWMPLWISGMTPVIELNDLSKLLPIVFQVVRFNLEGFISGFLTSREEPAPVSSGGISRVRKTG